jgi:hypothetical protein
MTTTQRDTKYLALILFPLVLFKFVIHWFGNQNYGFHRDELLHLSVSEHLDWGYYEFPPFIGFIGRLSEFLFDHSLAGTRLFPTLAGIAILILCVLMSKELGGKKGAWFLAGISVLAFIPFYRNHTLFQPVAFDQLFWTLGFYLMIRFINSENKRDLLLLGFVAGLGLLNKYTMLVWSLGITIGFIFYDRGAVFKSLWLYISGIIAFIIFLPNMIWQIQHDIPFLSHMVELQSSQLSGQGTWTFVNGQLEIIPTLAITLTGIGSLFFNRSLKQYRSLGVAFLVIFLVMWIMKAKAYYFFSAYPVVFAAGAVQIEHWFKKRPYLNYVFAISMLLPAVYIIPKMTPLLPIDTFTEWYDIPEENGRYEMTGDYADMFGWEEQVTLVDSVYRSFPDSIRADVQIWAENYGEAGAVQILGDKYGLPDPVSRHGSFWYWGHGNPNASFWISLGNEARSVHHIFNDCRLVKTITHTYAIGEENNIPLYICQDPKSDIPQWWADYEEFVFD